jgi:hypothetical protein
MLDALITSKTKIKLLLKFFLNSGNRDYLRGLESEFGDSSNSIRQELNKLETAGLLESINEGNKKIFNANTKHPLFPDIKNILMKFTGLDQLIIHVIDRLGEVNEVYLIGDLGRGIDSNLIDLIFVGSIDEEFLNQLISKAEKHIKKNIHHVSYSTKDFSLKKDQLISKQDLLLWKAG